MWKKVVAGVSGAANPWRTVARRHSTSISSAIDSILLRSLKEHYLEVSKMSPPPKVNPPSPFSIVKGALDNSGPVLRRSYGEEEIKLSVTRLPNLVPGNDGEDEEEDGDEINQLFLHVEISKPDMVDSLHFLCGLYPDAMGIHAINMRPKLEFHSRVLAAPPKYQGPHFQWKNWRILLDLKDRDLLLNHTWLRHVLLDLLMPPCLLSLGKQESSYYWHGRDKVTIRELNPKTLSSGLDDYPRASHPSEDERHLDLRCWMLLAANCMHSIAELLGIKDGSEKGYYSMAKQLSNFETLNEMHFDDVFGAYFDFGNHTEKVRLRWHEVRGSSSKYANRELIREVLEKPQLALVPHVGYVSLFPFMMKIIPPTSWVLEKQLDLISNRSILWSDYGLRSLARTSSMYMKRNTEHDPPYWRGPIWININYMILSALHHYAQEDGPYKARALTIYEELRKNLIGNVVTNYFANGYLWEQYDQKNKGNGKGAHPFTGWTSLVLLIMAEAY